MSADRPWKYYSAGDWVIRTRTTLPGSGSEWFGYAKRRSDGFCADDAVSEPINHEVYFQFGDTQGEVVAKLRREVLH